MSRIRFEHRTFSFDATFNFFINDLSQYTRQQSHIPFSQCLFSFFMLDCLIDLAILPILFGVIMVAIVLLALYHSNARRTCPYHSNARRTHPITLFLKCVCRHFVFESWFVQPVANAGS